MIGILPDLHLKENLSYADFISDARVSEKKEILDFIVKTFEPCDTIIMIGDQLDGINNLSSVIRDFVAFVERFKGKQLYILAGNHELKADGTTALDFLKEIDKPDWHIITNEILTANIQGRTIVFCPYFTKSQLKTLNNIRGTEELLDRVGEGDILFIHNAISDIKVTEQTQTNIFNGIVLPRQILEKKFKLIVCGHIHRPQVVGNTVITGSVFTSDINEIQKKIWTLDPISMSYKSYDLPGRPIMSDRNKGIKELMGSFQLYPKNAIIKMTIDNKDLKDQIEEIKAYLRENVDAYILLEQYPNEREKIHFEDGMLQLNTEDLLGIYAKTKKIDINKLFSAWELIKN